MSTVECVQVISAVCFPLTLIVLGINRWQLKKGIGVRSIQFIAAAMFFPAVIIMATTKVISGETGAALFGAFIG